jgi:hypothetical protein
MLTQPQVQRYSTESSLRDMMIAEKEVVLTFLLQLLSERGILDKLACATPPNQATATSRSGTISTCVRSFTLSASSNRIARSSVIPKYSFRSSRDTWDSCTLSLLAKSLCESP